MVPRFGVSAECQSIGTNGGLTKAWCPGLVSRPSDKSQEPVERSRGLVIQPPKLSVGAYFELSFLGCGFLIHLSNRSDSPQFRAPWKKIRKNTGHDRNRLYSRASIVLPVWRCIMFNDSYLRACVFLGCGFRIHLSNRSDSPRFRAPWKKIRQKYDIQLEPSLFKSHPLSCQYIDAYCSMVPT